ECPVQISQNQILSAAADRVGHCARRHVSQQKEPPNPRPQDGQTIPKDLHIFSWCCHFGCIGPLAVITNERVFSLQSFFEQNQSLNQHVWICRSLEFASAIVPLVPQWRGKIECE